MSDPGHSVILDMVRNPARFRWLQRRVFSAALAMALLRNSAFAVAGLVEAGPACAEASAGRPGSATPATGRVSSRLRQDGVSRVCPRWLASLPARVLLGLIWLYRRTLSPVLPLVLGPGCGCRFHPTCAVFAAESVREHGALRGSWLAVRRLLKCHPLHPGGFDPVPPSPRRNDADGCRAAARRRAVFPTSCGPATSAGPTHHSVIAGIIRTVRSNCMNPAKAPISAG
jgi:hypothetical protein